MPRGGVERIIRAAMSNWAMTLRLCLIVSVIAATLTIVVYFIHPSALSMFMR
jgi:hypothetical protein